MTWDEMYKLAKIYIVKYGTENIDNSFKTKDGITYCEDGFELGKWLLEQIEEYKKGNMNSKKSKKIRQLNIIKNKVSIKNDRKWDEMYELAKKYYEKYGDIDVPIDFKTKDGINYDENGKKLSIWLTTQKHKKRNNTLSVEKVTKLNEIKFQWKTNNKKWNKMYNVDKNYNQKYGNIELPIKSDFENKESLEDWIIKQKDSYKKGILSENKIHELNKIDIKFNEEDKYLSMWTSKFKLLLNYLNYYGNLNISNNFRTKDGINYDEEGMNLNNWLISQYYLFNNDKLTEKRKDMLKPYIIIFESGRKRFINSKITKEKLVLMKKKLTDLSYVKLDEQDSKLELTKQTLDDINNSYLKIFSNNK